MSDNDISETLGRILARAGSLPRADSGEPPCGAIAWAGSAVVGKTYCDGLAHRIADPSILRPQSTVMVGRCPYVVAAEIRSHVDEERQRLAGALVQSGGGKFDGYDSKRAEGSGRALQAMLAFSAGRPPSRGVLMCSKTGLGKSRLLLASHFTLLAGGISSQYVTANDLRPIFRVAFGFDDEAKREAMRAIDRYRRCSALHLDDLGNVRGSDAFHADFAAGLLTILDGRTGATATAMNCSATEAATHPDIGDRILSRLAGGAERVLLAGKDQRIAGEKTP